MSQIQPPLPPPPFNTAREVPTPLEIQRFVETIPTPQAAVAATQQLIHSGPCYLPVIDSRAANCDKCTLDVRRRAGQEVTADIGKDYAPGGLMFCAEAPGSNEVQQKRVLVGEAGRVFNMLINRIGLERKDIVCTNAVLCRPEDNKLENYPMSVECCNNRLLTEVWEYKPRVIVALGNHAVRALVGKVVVKNNAKEGPCTDCMGQGALRLGDVKWLSEKTLAKRIRDASKTEDGLGAETMVPCKQCKGKGVRKHKVPQGQLQTDRGVMDFAGAVIDIWNDPNFEHLKEQFPPETKYIVPTYHPSFLMREKDKKKGTPGGTFFQPYAWHHLSRAKRLLTEDFKPALSAFILDASLPGAPEELQTFLAPVPGVVYTIDIETEPMGGAAAQAPLAHDFQETEAISEDGEITRGLVCTSCGLSPSVAGAECADTLTTEEDTRKRTDPLQEALVCVGIGRSDTNEVCVLDTRGALMHWPAMQVLQDFLEDATRLKCFHNGAFDVAVLEARFSGLEAQSLEFQLANRTPVVRVKGYQFDTMILSKNLWPDVSKGQKGDEVGIPLDWVANAYTDTRPWKPKKKAAKAKGGRPIFDSFEDLALYNARDVISTTNSLYAMWDEAEGFIPSSVLTNKKLNPKQIELDVKLQQVAVDMQRVGLPIDRARLDEIKAKCKTQISTHANRFAELCGRPLYDAQTRPDGVNIDSPPQLEKVLFDEWQLPATKINTRKDGKTSRSTAFEVLQELAGRHEGVDALMEIRRLGQILKLISSWEFMVRDGFLHPSWRAAATVTGRFSSKPNCFDGETEILTTNGWVRFDQLQEGVPVAQWTPEAITFVKPTAYIRERAVEPLVHLNSQQIDLAVTKDHRCVLRHSKTGELRVFRAEDYPEGWDQLHGGYWRGGFRRLSPATVAFICATQADGSWVPDGVDFKFSKQRKITRLLWACEELGLTVKVRSGLKAGYHKANGEYVACKPQTRIKVEGPLVQFVKDMLGAAKAFGPWLLQWDPETLGLFADEVFLWDGCVTRMSHYASKDKVNADWVQTILSLSGKRARMRVYKPENPNAALSYQVDVTHRDWSGTTNVKRDTVEAPEVYCVSVPSSYILVRRNGKVQVTGQSQNWPANIKGVGNMRSIVKAPPGWLLVGSDFAALEQRIMGALTGGKLFTFVNKPDDDARKFDPDYDCHSYVARHVFGSRFLTPEMYFKPGQYTTESAIPDAIAKQKKAIRNDTKRVVYARNYRSGIDTIWGIVKEEDPKCPRDKIVDIVRGYDTLFPEVGKYAENALAFVTAHRYLQSVLLGRRRAFPFGGVSPTDAANFCIQSTGSDIVNLRTLLLLEQLPQDCHLILQGHDSLTVLCPERKADEVKVLMNQILPCRYDLGHGEMFFDASAQVGESWDKT